MSLLEELRLLLLGSFALFSSSLLSEGVSVRLTSPDQEKRMFMMATIMFMVEY